MADKQNFLAVAFSKKVAEDLILELSSLTSVGEGFGFIDFNNEKIVPSTDYFFDLHRLQRRTSPSLRALVLTRAIKIVRLGILGKRNTL